MYHHVRVIKRKRNGHTYATLCWEGTDGREHRESLGRRDRLKAKGIEQARRQKELDINTGEAPADPPGPLTLRVGMYDRQTMRRLPIQDGGGTFVGDSIGLAELQVVKDAE